MAAINEAERVLYEYTYENMYIEQGSRPEMNLWIKYILQVDLGEWAMIYMCIRASRSPGIVTWDDPEFTLCID